MSYISQIDDLIAQYAFLSSLQPGERIAQDQKTKKIIGKYHFPQTYISTACQAVSRTFIYSHDSSLEAINQIKKIVKNTEKVLNQCIFATQYQAIRNFNDTYVKLTSLHQLIEKTLPKLDTYQKTVFTCSPNLISKPEKEREERSDLLEKTKNKLIKIFERSRQKITNYNTIVMEHSKKEISKQEKLKCTLFALMNPKTPILLDEFYDSLDQSSICLASKKFPTLLVKEMLCNTFGESIVNDVFHFYFNEDTPILKLEDIRSILIGIVANLTKKDIEFILTNKSGIAYDKIKNLRIESSVDLAKILFCLRDIDLNDYAIDSSKNYSYQVAGDLQFLEACKFNDHYNFIESKFSHSKVRVLKKFGYTEQISRNIVYALYNTSLDLRQFRNGILFSIYDKNGEIKCKEGHHIFNKDAICALGVVPAFESENSDNSIQIAFRGTADLESLYRDINPLERESLTRVLTNPLTQGPGTLSYNSNKISLLANSANFLNYALEKFGANSINLEIMGHSLGAGDVQRFLNDICNKINHEHGEAYPSPFVNIDKIDLYGYNPPAIEEKVCKDFIATLAEMQLNSENKLQIAIRYFMSEFDFVSSTGECFVGHGAEKLKNIGISRFEFSHPSVEGNIFGDSANSMQGRSPLESNPVLRYGYAHTSFDLSEVKYDNREKMNPVSICGACTNISEDETVLNDLLIPENCLLSKENLTHALKSDFIFKKA